MLKHELLSLLKQKAAEHKQNNANPEQADVERTRRDFFDNFGFHPLDVELKPLPDNQGFIEIRFEVDGVDFFMYKQFPFLHDNYYKAFNHSDDGKATDLQYNVTIDNLVNTIINLDEEDLETVFVPVDIIRGDGGYGWVAHLRRLKRD